LAQAPSSSAGLRSSETARSSRSDRHRSECGAEVPCRDADAPISRPRKRSVTLTLSPSSKKRRIGLHLHVVVVIVDGRAHLDFLSSMTSVSCALRPLFLLLVFEFPVVHELDDGGRGLGRDLHKIETLLLSDARASSVPISPNLCPSAPIRRMVRANISSFTRGPSLAGAGAGMTNVWRL